jgi:hypothetical protein
MKIKTNKTFYKRTKKNILEIKKIKIKLKNIIFDKLGLKDEI